MAKITAFIKKYWGWALLIGILIFIGSLKVENWKLKKDLNELKRTELENNQKVVYESIPEILGEKSTDQLCVMGEKLWGN